MVDLDPGGTDDMEVVADHQVVDAVDRARQAVFDGQDAVAAQAALDGAENALKGFAIHDRGIADDLFAGQLGIGAFHALAGDHGFFGEEGGHGGNGAADLLSQRALGMAVQLLAQQAVVQQEVVQGPHALFVLFPSQLRGRVQLFPFLFRVRDGDPVFPFEAADFTRRLHPPAVKLHDPAVDFADLLVQFPDFHFLSSRSALKEPMKRFFSASVNSLYILSKLL